MLRTDFALQSNAPWRSCIAIINGLLIDNEQDLDIVNLMYNLLEYCATIYSIRKFVELSW